MRYAIVTFGCRVNQADSLRVEEELRARGGRPSPPDHANVVVVNTCSVTSTADQGARQVIRRLARDNPSAKIVVTGCYATRRPEEVAALPNVLRLVRNPEKESLVTLLAADPSVTTAGWFGGGDGPCGAALEPGLAGRTAFTLRLQTGCDQRCSYCIIPSTRGPGRSLPVDAVVAEVARIQVAGFLEIALTGVHLGSYGRDLQPASTLIELLQRLAGLPGETLFRISSLEPMDCTPDLVDLVHASGRFAPHFHLPLQHASDRMLAAMRRPYGLDEYRRLVDRIRDRMPHASIGSDVIVGFPGETDEDFAACERYLPGSPLTHLHVFPYSDRPGTEAEALPGKVPGAVVRGRARRVREMGAELTRRFHLAQVGTMRPALTIEDGSAAVTDNYLKVRIGPGHRRNERLWIRLREGPAGLEAETVPSSGRPRQ
jgi:threonylcarbamoyladenosine tRNA methylthiotransferase MtaB